MTQKQIRDSLLEQLENQKKTSGFYIDLVNDYMDYWKLKKLLLKDISDKGIRYETVNGNGLTIEKANESVASLQKTTGVMLKILTDLNLKEPISTGDNEDDYL